MNTHQDHQDHQETKGQKKPKALDHDKGFYHSCTVLLPIQKVYDFCRKPENLMLAVQVLPEEFMSNLNFTLTEDQTTGKTKILKWTNGKDSKVEFTATMTFSEAPAGRGTIISTEAFFEIPSSKILTKIFRMDDAEPSMLVSAFLRRLKAQMEIGEIATTEGQPSGREEILQ